MRVCEFLKDNIKESKWIYYRSFKDGSFAEMLHFWFPLTPPLTHFPRVRGGEGEENDRQKWEETDFQDTRETPQNGGGGGGFPWILRWKTLGSILSGKLFSHHISFTSYHTGLRDFEWEGIQGDTVIYIQNFRKSGGKKGAGHSEEVGQR